MRSVKASASAIYFAFSNVAAGVLHYLFQVWTSQRLDLQSFGELNSWVAYYSISLSLGMFAQYGANFFVASPARLKIMAWFAIIFAAMSLGAPYLYPTASPWLIGFFGLFLGVIFNWLSGQAQVRLAFVVMGTGMLMTGISKFALAGVGFPAVSESWQMAWAVALAYSPALIFLCAPLIIWGSSWKPTSDQKYALKTGLGATATLAIASVLIPQMDIVAIHRTQSPDLVGEFARISLLYKAVFFGFLIFAQWLLPQQLGQKSQNRLVAWLGQSRWRILIASMGFAAIAMSAAFLIGVSRMPTLRDQALWIGLSCLNMVFLTNTFFSIQLNCVQQKIRGPITLLVMLGFELVGAIIWKPTVTQYLIYAILINSSLWFLLGKESRRSN